VLFAACALSCASLVAEAGATTAVRPSGGDLSPRLAQLAKPSVGGAPLAQQAAKLSVASAGPGSLLRTGNRVLVDVHIDGQAAAGAEALRAAGAQIVNLSNRYQTVTVAVRPGELPEVAAAAGVEGVTEVLTPLVAATGPGCPAGAVVSEGDDQLRAAAARDGFDVDGSGVTVGILSDSFDRDAGTPTDASEDAESGDLPGLGNPCGHLSAVNVLVDLEPPGDGSDEGRAMAQIVHDLAPGANLAFATAFTGELAFAGNIERLSRPVAEGGAGAQAIVDDVIYFEEPFFQDGPVAVAVDAVTAAGASYFSAAGNNNLIDEAGNDIASWEAPEFRDGGGCPTGTPLYAKTCMDFDPSGTVDPTFGITVEAKATLTIDLQWAQPWNGVTTDLDAYITTSPGLLLAKGESFNVAPPRGSFATQRPVEVLSWTNEGSVPLTVQLAINRCDTTTCDANGGDTTNPRLKVALVQNGGGVTATEYPESSGGDVVGPTIFGHAGAAGAVAVGAVPFFDGTEPEPYSSRGPVTHYFGPVTGTSPASPLDAPEILPKPDLVATDCGANTFFGFPVEKAPGEVVWRFCGTSAAAPHAAAVAALIRDRNPTLSPQQVRATLAAGAQPVGGFGPNEVGAGLVDAVDALAAVPPVLKIVGGKSTTAPLQEALPDSAATNPPASVSAPSIARSLAVFFIRRPPKVVRTRARRVRAVFRFGPERPGVTFLCRIDGRPLRTCPARFVHRFAVGAHAVRVRARDGAGNLGPFSVYRFRVVDVVSLGG